MEKNAIRASLVFIVCLLAFGMYTALSVHLVDGFDFIEQFQPGMNKASLADAVGATLECENAGEGLELCIGKDKYLFFEQKSNMRMRLENGLLADMIFEFEVNSRKYSFDLLEKGMTEKFGQPVREYSSASGVLELIWSANGVQLVLSANMDQIEEAIKNPKGALNGSPEEQEKLKLTVNY